MVGDRFSSSTSCSGWLHETAPARPDPSLSCLFLKVATHPSWIPSSSRAARPPGMRPLAATVRRRPAGGCGPAPASGIQPSGMHPQPGPGCARVRRRRPAPSLRVPRSRTGPSVWPGRESRRTGGRCPATAAPGHAPVPGGRAPYAVPRRTRRRGDAVRGAAGPAGWGRWRAGTACACCARYSTSWSPASSSSCS